MSSWLERFIIVFCFSIQYAIVYIQYEVEKGEFVGDKFLYEGHLGSTMIYITSK